MLNPQHLLTFCVVAKFCSITRAAHSLNIGQPAVSGQLKLLQEAVGEPLYEREGHRIVLTRGEAFVIARHIWANKNLLSSSLNQFAASLH